MSVGGYLAPDLPVDPIPVPRTKEAEEMVIQAEFFFHEEARRADKVAREDGALWSRVSECAQRIALIQVVSDGCEPVSAMTMRLSPMPRRDRATQRERRFG